MVLIVLIKRYKIFSFYVKTMHIVLWWWYCINVSISYIFTNITWRFFLNMLFVELAKTYFFNFFLRVSWLGETLHLMVHLLKMLHGWVIFTRMAKNVHNIYNSGGLSYVWNDQDFRIVNFLISRHNFWQVNIIIW